MIDLRDLLEQPTVYRQACETKHLEVDINRLIEAKQEQNQLIKERDELRHQLNQGSEQKPTPEQMTVLKSLKDKIKNLEARVEELETEVVNLAEQIPNPPLADVPVGLDQSENVVVRTVGQIPNFNFEVHDHVALGETLNIIDIERAAKVTGTRFAFLKGALAQLEFALVQFTFEHLTDSTWLAQVRDNNSNLLSAHHPVTPFIPVVPPVMIRPEVFKKMDRLEPQAERYHLAQDDRYLIGSAEHTLGAMHLDETFDEKQLPLRYVGFSTSFRREAGSYGKDTRGILRVHQFDKLEMESFTIPEQGQLEQDFMVAIQEKFLQELELPYRVVMICTGDMGKPDARQIDLECWLPAQKQYRETHTADYMTDYQARRLNTRVRRHDGQSQFVHMNDATAFAIGRTLIAILENYQQADGSVRVPQALQKYVPFKVIEK